MKRRELLALAAAPAVLGARRALGAVPFAKKPLGLEIYSLRREMGEDVPGTLPRIRAMGFSEVEVPGFYGLSASAFRGRLDDAGLAATAMVAQWESLDKDVEAACADAKTLGASYVVCGWIPHDGAFAEPDCRRAVDRFNAWAKAVRKAGLTLCYHPHGYEFAPAGAGAGTLCDVLIRETAASGMQFELDAFWVLHGGEDPVRLLARYPDRFPLVHLKDLAKGTPTGVHTGQAPDETSVPVGTGQVDFVAFLAMAEKVGVKRYYIEDEHPDAARQVPRSLAWLRSHGF